MCTCTHKSFSRQLMSLSRQRPHLLLRGPGSRIFQGKQVNQLMQHRSQAEILKGACPSWAQRNNCCCVYWTGALADWMSTAMLNQ